MSANIRLSLVLHNHQPIGNFDHVIEQAYEDSYLPFLDVFEKYENIRISLHTSGPLMEWFDQHRPEYLDRVAALVEKGRIEIIGGPFYEPILAMIPSRDRKGQIITYTHWLESRLNAKVNGMWVPERVWEQSMTSDLVDAGMKYTVLDDFHFLKAGCEKQELYNYFITENEGRTMKVYPGSEKLRYLIPFCEPEETVAFLRQQAEKHPGSVAVFGDDGEKFGTWPNTKKHVYEDGWLVRFFDALEANKDWLITSTLYESSANTQPAGKIYLPDCSYREMTEWALPVAQQSRLDNIHHSFQDDPRWDSIKRFMQGGFWRNFKIKYPETDEMYARMMAVSMRLESCEKVGLESEKLHEARKELFRGQCNCTYWHGAFGGIYLPHLRNAVYKHLINADNIIDELMNKSTPRVESAIADLNFDGKAEIRLENESLIALIAPLNGGQLYGLDVRRICHNLQATLARRPEVYHEKVRNHANQDGHEHDEAASIHDMVIFKQEGLEKRLQYDLQKRNSMIDRFYDDDVTLEQIYNGEATERGDFASGEFLAKQRDGNNKIQIQMVREGNAWGVPFKMTKGITMFSGSSNLQVAYLLEGLPTDRAFHFGVEFNLAGLPSNADDRFYYQVSNNLGHLGSKLDLSNQTELSLVDEWLGIDIGFRTNRSTNFWTYPVETVSQSEAGFELVHQAVVVQPHWMVQGDADGRWSVTIDWNISTEKAEVKQRKESCEVSSC